MTVCQDCAAELNDSNWTPSMQKYRRYICGPCWTARQRRYDNADPHHKEKKRALAEQRKARWTPERKQEEVRKRYGRLIKRKYGISLEDYEEMQRRQGNACAICGTAEPRGRGGFHVDHCHETNEVRALLCTMCNMMIGMASDKPEVLRRAADYLEHHQYMGLIGSGANRRV